VQRIAPKEGFSIGLSAYCHSHAAQCLKVIAPYAAGIGSQGMWFDIAI
jgi:hypothetical protein